MPEHATGRPHEVAEQIDKLGATKVITPRAGWQFTPHHAREQLQRQWQVGTAGGFGFADDDPAILATAAVLSYLEETQKTGLAHIRPPATDALPGTVRPPAGRRQARLWRGTSTSS